MKKTEIFVLVGLLISLASASAFAQKISLDESSTQQPATTLSLPQTSIDPYFTQPIAVAAFRASLTNSWSSVFPYILMTNLIGYSRAFANGSVQTNFITPSNTEVLDIDLAVKPNSSQIELATIEWSPANPSNIYLRYYLIANSNLSPTISTLYNLPLTCPCNYYHADIATDSTDTYIAFAYAIFDPISIQDTFLVNLYRITNGTLNTIPMGQVAIPLGSASNFAWSKSDIHLTVSNNNACTIAHLPVMGSSGSFIYQLYEFCVDLATNIPNLTQPLPLGFNVYPGSAYVDQEVQPTLINDIDIYGSYLATTHYVPGAFIPSALLMVGPLVGPNWYTYTIYLSTEDIAPIPNPPSPSPQPIIRVAIRDGGFLLLANTIQLDMSVDGGASWTIPITIYNSVTTLLAPPAPMEEISIPEKVSGPLVVSFVQKKWIGPASSTYEDTLRFLLPPSFIPIIAPTSFNGVNVRVIRDLNVENLQ